MSTVAKFRCYSVTDYGTAKAVTLQAVYAPDDKSHENYKFWQSSPSGKIELSIANLPAAEMFEPGGEFYVTFSPAYEVAQA